MVRKRDRRTKQADPPLKHVKVYSTPACPWCKVAKAYLKDNDIPFMDIDVSRDRAGLKEMLAMTGQHGVPVLLVGEKTMVGWNPGEFEKLRRH
ncbi:MAG: glutaredoxin family protein [Coriobacteriia bacterium]|nr:glutaredoxin family protein [Coriobacteriia bacterium]